MGQGQTTDQGVERAFLCSLEGIRGLGFLPVFLGHYLAPVLMSYGKRGWLFPLWVLAGTAWIAVPMFFVLSGFLIGGLLIDTRDRQGYFAVFYLRRILRVFPVYYLALLAVAAVAIANGLSLHFNFWSHFLYIQNLSPHYEGSMWVRPLSQMVPLWSLAVEEQFYIVWPLVVWLCRRQRALLCATLVLIGMSCALRIAAPRLHLTPMQCYFFTPTRIDAILLGVLLAVLRRGRAWSWMMSWSKLGAAAGMAAMLALSATSGWLLPDTYRRMAFVVPFANVVAVAVILAAMDTGSAFCRICSNARLCWFGSRVYSMYVIHYLFLGWFTGTFAPWLGRFVGFAVAYAVMMGMAFALTVLLAELSYRFVERPAMALKSRIRYGGVKKRQVSTLEAQPMLAQTE